MDVSSFLGALFGVLIGQFVWRVLGEMRKDEKKTKPQKPSKTDAAKLQVEEDNLMNYTADKYPRK